MTRKRFIKMMMAFGVPRNEAAVYATGVSGKIPYTLIGGLALTEPAVRAATQLMMAKTMGGLRIKVEIKETDKTEEVTVCFT